MNLLKETVEAIKRGGHKPDDVVYIGSRDGYACTWDEFTRMADVEYDDGYGGQEVARDLEIHFRDGGWLERGEYDGSEWWSYREPFTPPTETKRIERVVRDFDHGNSYGGIAALHDEEWAP